MQILRARSKRRLLKKREIRVILGFLSSCAESDPPFYNSTLDYLVNDDVLGEWFPILQTTSTIDQRGVERLQKALDIGRANIYTFQYLAWGRAHESIGDEELAKLLKKILSREGGIDVGTEILEMRFHGRDKESQKCSDSLIPVARDVLSMHTFGDERKGQSNHEYALAEIVRSVLADQTAFPPPQLFASASQRRSWITVSFPLIIRIC